MYKVTEIEISHNKRLRSGLIESVVINPQSLYQIIVGPNGFGKSALLDEITAYPSAGNAFEKGGVSRLKIESDYGIIETKSIFESDGKHEFWLNGENLNDGGTSTVQRDLAEKYLKVNKFSALIQSGQFSFSEASPAKRQEVLTQLADSDMTFANFLFQRARKKLSHSIGAVNALEESLAEKQRHQISEEEFTRLSQRLEEYQTLSTEILKGYREIPRQSTYVDIEGEWASLAALAKNTASKIPESPLNATDRTEWVEKLNKVKEYLITQETRKKALQEEYDDIEGILKRSTDASEENINKVKESVTYWDNQLTTYRKLPLYAPSVEYVDGSVEYALKELNTIFPEWQKVVSEIHADPEGKFTRERYETLLKNKQVFQEHFNSLSAKQSQYREQFEHMAQGTEVHCPKCEFHFIPGVSADARPRLTQKLNEIHESLEQGRKAIDENYRNIEEMEIWLEQYRRIIGLRNLCPCAQPTFLELDRRVTLKDEPLRALQVMVFLKEDLEKKVLIEKALEEKRKAEKTLEELQSNVVYGIEGIRARYEKIKTQLEELYHGIDDSRKEISMYENALAIADRYETAVNELNRTHESLIDKTIKEIEYGFNAARLALIQDLQGHIGTLTKTLNDAKTLNDQIADTVVQITKQKRKTEAMRLVVGDLSPKSGVVAEQMNDFIRIFTEQMNDVVAEIWSHPMEVLVGKPNDNELTYTFPIRLHDSDDYIVPDLKVASDGQRKIFDFAFQVTAMLYLGLTNVPLELDEVDRPLSPVHKARLMGFIIRGVENARFSQVFLISHHTVSHGALPFSDIIDFDFRHASEGVNHYAKFR